MAEHEDFPPRMTQQSSLDTLLITPERSAKLDLLIHLLSNASRAIVLCGCQGIGKTTLLKLAQQRHENHIGQYCLLTGSADLTLPVIQMQLLQLHPNTHDLIALFEKLATLQQVIVLMIDDAGKLAPYLISDLLDCAARYPALKLVFALTHDELATKTYSDSAITDCHIIEIPPLSEQQCGDFLQHLAIKSTLGVSLQRINDTMISDLYQQTHGIPARILARLPVLVRPPKKSKSTYWLVITLLIIIALAFALINECAHSALLKSLIDR